MNDKTMEEVLFKAPRPLAPAGLLKEVQAEIALPSAKPAAKAREWKSPLRRWFPALAFGVLMLSCALMIAVQASWSTDLKVQNDVLRAATADLPKLREQHVALEQAQANQADLLQLRKDNEELHSLQAEVAQLSNLPARIQQLQRENKRLAAAPVPNANASNSATFFADAQAEAERIQCINNLKQIGLSMRVWAQDNDDKYPQSVASMSNELNSIKFLFCPSDASRAALAARPMAKTQLAERAINTDTFSSYKFTVQPDDENYPECITARCPIHHNYLLADGSVQSVDPEKYREYQKDGRYYLAPVVSNQIGTNGSGQRFIQFVAPVQ
jgi:hypothetical protein